VEAEKFARHDLARARVRNGLMVALLALCPIRLKNFAALERPRMAEQLHRPIFESIATRSSSLWVHDECPLDILNDRSADDHKKPRYFDIQGYS
jgi:hypothetical protein